MPIVQAALTEPCPCGSQLMAKLCCYPVKPPINSPFPPYVRETIVDTVSPSLDVILSSNAPKPVKDVATRLSSFTITQAYAQESGPGLLPRDQASPQIASVLGYSLNEYYLNTFRHEHMLVSPLHIVKYHQQQCMYRLFQLQRNAKQRMRKTRGIRLAPKQVRMLQIVQFEDLPLRAEFEAFAARIASALDALAKYVCDCIGKNKKRYGEHFKLLNHLRDHQNASPEFSALRNVYSKYEGWSETIIGDLRHVVMHEGTLWSLEPSKDLSDDLRFSPPSNGGQRIDELCVSHWKALMEMVSSVRQELLSLGKTN